LDKIDIKLREISHILNKIIQKLWFTHDRTCAWSVRVLNCVCEVCVFVMFTFVASIYILDIHILRIKS